MKDRPPIRVAVDAPFWDGVPTFIVEFEVGHDSGIMVCANMTADEVRTLRDKCSVALETATP
jgi:hypothetical protein